MKQRGSCSAVVREEILPYAPCDLDDGAHCCRARSLPGPDRACRAR
jgi:hypothetical protein